MTSAASMWPIPYPSSHCKGVRATRNTLTYSILYAHATFFYEALPSARKNHMLIFYTPEDVISTAREVGRALNTWCITFDFGKCTAGKMHQAIKAVGNLSTLKFLDIRIRSRACLPGIHLSRGRAFAGNLEIVIIDADEEKWQSWIKGIYKMIDKIDKEIRDGRHSCGCCLRDAVCYRERWRTFLKVEQLSQSHAKGKSQR